MTLRRASILVVALAAIVACGGTTASTGGGGAPDGSTTDDGGPCITPTEGAACTADQTACSLGGDRCCVGFWTCTTSARTWHHEYLGCACQVSTDAGGGDASKDAADAGPLVCGNLTCRAGEYCYVQSGGAVPPEGGVNTSYECKPLPGACASTPTCACLTTAGVGCRCTDGTAGPRVECDVP
jgi:hypothetical protein